MSNIEKSETNKINIKEGEISSLEQQHTYIGPLPAYQEMAGYESVKEGFAERMMIMAEKEQSERLKREMIRVESESSLMAMDGAIRKRGQWFAITAVSFIIGLCGYGFYLGYSTAVASLGSTVIVALAGVFIYQSRKAN